MEISEIPHGGDAWRESVSLREAVLRKPLGLAFDEKELARESEHHHLAACEADILVGILVLVPGLERTRMKMRQVAVDEAQRGRGIGKALVHAAEAFARDRGCAELYCHARDAAVPFYLNLGYRIEGERFIEVSIPHYRMSKLLRNEAPGTDPAQEAL